MFIAPYTEEIKELTNKLKCSSFATQRDDKLIKRMYKEFSAADADTKIVDTISYAKYNQLQIYTQSFVYEYKTP